MDRELYTKSDLSQWDHVLYTPPPDTGGLPKDGFLHVVGCDETTDWIDQIEIQFSVAAGGGSEKILGASYISHTITKPVPGCLCYGCRHALGPIMDCKCQKCIAVYEEAHA